MLLKELILSNLDCILVTITPHFLYGVIHLKGKADQSYLQNPVVEVLVKLLLPILLYLIILCIKQTIWIYQTF